MRTLPEPDCTSQPSRVLRIANCHNLRDMGGYLASGGQRVRWRTLYRSGLMTGLADIAVRELSGLGIVTICDLRGSDERRRRPMEWRHSLEIDYWCRDYNLSLGNLQEIARRGTLAPGEMMAIIHEVYRQLPYEQAPSYREIFRRLTAGRVPLLFNCSAGKDRTGIAAALVLSALGVSRETIAEDYCLTDHALERLIDIFLEDPRHAGFATVPRELYLPMLRADAAYLDIMFDEIEARHGSVESYLHDVLEIGEQGIAVLREHLLER
jgi:protein-tyrosine phosphatase